MSTEIPIYAADNMEESNETLRRNGFALTLESETCEYRRGASGKDCRRLAFVLCNPAGYVVGTFILDMFETKANTETQLLAAARDVMAWLETAEGRAARLNKNGECCSRARAAR